MSKEFPTPKTYHEEQNVAPARKSYEFARRSKKVLAAGALVLAAMGIAEQHFTDNETIQDVAVVQLAAAGALAAGAERERRKQNAALESAQRFVDERHASESQARQDS